MRSSRTELLSIRQVAWLTGGSVATVCHAVRVGTLPVVWRRGELRVPASAVAELAGGGRR